MLFNHRCENSGSTNFLPALMTSPRSSTNHLIKSNEITPPERKTELIKEKGRQFTSALKEVAYHEKFLLFSASRQYNWRDGRRLLPLGGQESFRCGLSPRSQVALVSGGNYCMLKLKVICIIK